MKHRRSYWKSTGLALGVCVVSVAALAIASDEVTSGATGAAGKTLIVVTLLAASLVAVGGGICLWRDRRIADGKTDPLVAALNRVPPRGRLATLGLRVLLGSPPRPGDIVRVRSLAEIRDTLTVDGTFEDLPFMPEMQAYCGHRYRVHRRVDKINDMRNKTGLRRMRGVVTLTAVRCNGAQHDGCQAECQILWKDAWLERASSGEPEALSPPAETPLAPRSLQNERGAYVCQMTRLWEASQPMSRFDPRQDLRPLVYGNVAPLAYAALMLTRSFNLFQALRGGVSFPHMPPGSAADAVGQPLHEGCVEGSIVTVRSRDQIAKTLVNSRTKGLWFDADMLRFCGTTSVVERRVERIIHESTGKMVTMRTPSLFLREIVATGEFLRLCPQHEHIFWREVWLEPAGHEARDGDSAS